MSRIGGLEGTRLPDFSIGATVLVVAIALPFFVFTRMEHAHRSAAQRPPAAAASAQVRPVTTTPDPTAPVLSVPPQAASKATPSPRPSAKPATVPPPSVRATPTSTPTPTPTPAPDFAPVAVLTMSVTSGPAPLTVIADASGLHRKTVVLATSSGEISRRNGCGAIGDGRSERGSQTGPDRRSKTD